MAIDASVRPRSVSLSLALHAAALVAVLSLSALGRENLPSPVVVAGSRPIIFDAAPLRVAGGSQTQGRMPRLPSLRPRSTVANAPRATQVSPLLAATTIQEVSDPSDVPSGTTDGDCTEGCVVGSRDSGSDPSGGAGSEVEQAVHIVSGGVIRPPQKVRDTPPIYPELAVRSRLEGSVEIECRIDATGRVVDATVLHGHPLLSPAALVAVREWAYRPTLLNGVPVSVIMTVTVHFRLRH